jgi:uncharacterized protein YyaL (SSP411 family)
MNMEKTPEGRLWREDESGDFRFSPRPNRAREIAWMPWGEEAFRRAAREEKPLLLSISAVWCHWCHVMDETSYSDREVIDLINRNYVPVRVDSDRNPDINSRYNQGGWPTTVFLNPEGQALAGATYIPPEIMRKALARISELYRQGEGKVTFPPETAADWRDRGAEPGQEMVREVGDSILCAWDRRYGGLGSAPKFPQPETIDLALDLYRDEGKGEYLEYALSSLRSMISGGLWDPEEGGFFRYSTTRDWSVPHYEKMLSDNSELLSVLLRAYSLTGEDLFMRTAEGTAAYIRRTLSDGERLLFGSQDADEEYYLLPASEREVRTPPQVDRTVYADQVSPAAVSLARAGIIMRREELLSMALSSLEFLWAELFRPEVGMAHYHDASPHRWGLLNDQVATAGAFAWAYGITGKKDYLERAHTLLRLVLELHWDEEGSELVDVAPAYAPVGLDPSPAGPAAQAAAAEAMLYFSAITGERDWRDKASTILGGWNNMADKLGIMAAPLARAANLYLRGELTVRVPVSFSPAGRDLLRISLLSPLPRVVPLPAEVGTIEGEVYAEVCTADACHLHTGDPGELADYLEVRRELFEDTEGGER